MTERRQVWDSGRPWLRCQLYPFTVLMASLGLSFFHYKLGILTQNSSPMICVPIPPRCKIQESLAESGHAPCPRDWPLKACRMTVGPRFLPQTACSFYTQRSSAPRGTFLRYLDTDVTVPIPVSSPNHCVLPRHPS